MNLGEPARAFQLFEEALKSQTSILGKRHPDTLVTMAGLGVYYANQSQLEKAKPLLTEALEACRLALDRNHMATETALAGLASVFVQERDFNRLGEVLLEAAEIDRYRWGIDHGSTSQAYQVVGKFFIFQKEYGNAEPFYRDCLIYWVKNDPGNPIRFDSEFEYGITLLAQKKYDEARSHLLIGYDGIRTAQGQGLAGEGADLGRLIEQVERLRGADGRPIRETTMLASLQKDPALQGIVLDLQFPVVVFAP